MLAIGTCKMSQSQRMISGNVGIGTTGPGSKLEVAGNITPSANDTYSLGSIDKVWKSLYVGASSLFIGGKKLSNNAGELEWGGKVGLTSVNISSPSMWTLDGIDSTKNCSGFGENFTKMFDNNYSTYQYCEDYKVASYVDDAFFNITLDLGEVKNGIFSLIASMNADECTHTQWNCGAYGYMVLQVRFSIDGINYDFNNGAQLNKYNTNFWYDSIYPTAKPDRTISVNTPFEARYIKIMMLGKGAGQSGYKDEPGGYFKIKEVKVNTYG